MDWNNTSHVLQAIYWTMLLFVGLHGYAFGSRTVI